MRSDTNTVRNSAAPRRPRADAQRNRAMLIDAARELLSERAGDFSLEGVARRAGVGIGTLYRHFPTRELLVAAVYEAEVDALATQAAEYLKREPALEALRAWLGDFSEFAAAKRGMRDVLRSIGLNDALSGSHTAVRTRMADAIAPLLRAGAEESTIRPDVSPDDVVILVAGALMPHDVDSDQTARLLDLIITALRA